MVATPGPLATDCLIWTKSKSQGGYGKCGKGGMPSWGVHRSMWIFRNGPIADGLVLDHLCMVPACCNVDHLELVTIRENILRGVDYRHGVDSRLTCVRGHPLTPENTQTRLVKGKWVTRRCRVCTRETHARRYVPSQFRKPGDRLYLRAGETREK